MFDEGGEIIMASVLDTELQFFNENRQEWFKYHAGKFALVKGTILYGFYDNNETAYRVGVEVWGNVAFLIQEVQLKDAMVWIFRQLMLFKEV